MRRIVRSIRAFVTDPSCLGHVALRAQRAWVAEDMSVRGALVLPSPECFSFLEAIESSLSMGVNNWEMSASVGVPGRVSAQGLLTKASHSWGIFGGEGTNHGINEEIIGQDRGL